MRIYKRYKFLRTGLKSEYGNFQWKKNKWEKIEGEIQLCNRGFHACKEPYWAFSYVQGELLAEVECRGKHLSDENKEVWFEQRVVKTYKWTKKDSLRLAIFSAELVLKNFEKKYPDDPRPRQAIEAAKKVLFKDTKANRDAAAGSAWSAWSARSAWSAWSAGSARLAAESAARSAAESAAESAARSAWSAARSAARSAAESAARSAATAKTYKAICRYFKQIVAEKRRGE